MEYTYTCMLEQDDDCWYACFPQWGGCMTSGDTREEVLRQAADLLVLELSDCIERGDELPDPGTQFAHAPVTVEITPEIIEETHYETLDQAAEWLEVTRACVEELVASGQLESKVFDGQLEVLIESVNRYQDCNGLPPFDESSRKKNPMEDEGMTEKQFASYLNQLIGRFEDALEFEDSEQFEKRVKAIVADMKTDRDTNR